MQQLRQETAVPEYAEAFRSIRMAKFWLSLLTVLTLVVFLGTFIVVEFTTLLNEPAAQPAVTAGNVPETPKPPTDLTPEPAKADKTAKKTPAATPAPQPAAKPATRPANGDGIQTAKYILNIAMPILKYLGFMAAILLSLTLLIGFKVALIGQLGGVRPLVSAFFWSLLLLVFLTPWDQLFEPTARCIGLFVPDAANVSVIDGIRQFKIDLVGTTDNLSATSRYYFKFLGWPGLALLTWLIVMVKFGRGYARLDFPTAISKTGYGD